ncbi:MAG TPA: hypothetical protein VGC79_17455 [Polyangiaceae bacterium]
MKLPDEIRRAFASYGRQGGKVRAARMSPEARRATARRAATLRWIRERFGKSSFAELGLPGGEIVDTGLAHLGDGTVSAESLAVSLAAQRLRREGVPVGATLQDPENRLYDLLATTSGDLAHARYLAWLQQLESFADASRYRRLQDSDAR